jgi:hypothetical protein
MKTAVKLIAGKVVAATLVAHGMKRMKHGK